MIHYSDVRKIKTLTNPDEVNELLHAKDECWELINVQKLENGFLFLLGRTFDGGGCEGTD